MTLFAKVSDSGWIIPAAWLASVVQKTYQLSCTCTSCTQLFSETPSHCQQLTIGTVGLIFSSPFS